MEHESLQEKTRTRLIREEGCVVLRAEARWWERANADEGDLFSSMYRQAAEVFLAWAEQAVGERAREDYRRGGSEGTHYFRRYVCRYDVEIGWGESEDEWLTTTVTAEVKRAGRSTPLASETRRFVWYGYQAADGFVVLCPEKSRLVKKMLVQKVQKK